LPRIPHARLPDAFGATGSGPLARDHGACGAGRGYASPSAAYYPPVPPAIYDWTGIYVGGHIGGGILVDSVSQNGVSPGGSNLAGSGDLRPAGVIGGGQIGANYEFAPWVVGIEGTFTDSGISGSTLVRQTRLSRRNASPRIRRGLPL